MSRHDDALALIGRLRYFQQQHTEARRDREPRKAAIANDQVRGLLDSAGPDTVREALLTALRPDQQQTMPVVLGEIDQARIVSLDAVRLLIERRDHAVAAYATHGEQHRADCNRAYADLWAAIEALGEAAFATDVARAVAEGRTP